MDLGFLSPFVPGFKPPQSARGDICSRFVSPQRNHVVASVESNAEYQRLTRKLEELQALKDRQQLTRTETQDAAKPNKADVNVSKQKLTCGKHSEESRFLSFSTVDSADFYPRVVPLLGDLSAVHPDDVCGAGRLDDGNPPEKGRFLFANIPPCSGSRVVAVNNVGALVDCRDPVAIEVKPGMLSDNMQDDADARTLLVVERDLAGEEFDNYKFYLWGVGDSVRVGWLKEMPAEADALCLGRVVCALAEEPVQRRQAKSCWQEEAEYF